MTVAEVMEALAIMPPGLPVCDGQDPVTQITRNDKYGIVILWFGSPDD